MAIKGAALRELDKLDKKLTKLADEVSKRIFGKTRTEAHETHTCVACSSPAIKFENDESEIEWRISGLCQYCQDYIKGIELIGKDSPQTS